LNFRHWQHLCNGRSFVGSGDRLAVAFFPFGATVWFAGKWQYGAMTVMKHDGKPAGVVWFCVGGTVRALGSEPEHAVTEAGWLCDRLAILCIPTTGAA
jgi:hypothetical protein